MTLVLCAEWYVRQAHNLKVVAINLSPHVHPKQHLLMNLLRQKVSFLIKLFFKNPSERLGRAWTDRYAILYECTALIFKHFSFIPPLISDVLLDI